MHHNYSEEELTCLLFSHAQMYNIQDSIITFQKLENTIILQIKVAYDLAKYYSCTILFSSSFISLCAQRNNIVF